MLLRRLGHINLPANNRPFTEKGIIGEQLETIFASMVKNHAHQIYGYGYDLPDVFEIHGLALLEDDLVLVIYIDEADFEAGNTVAVGHLTEEYELVVAHGVLGSVDILNNIYDAGHSRYAVENHPVAYNYGKRNRSYLIHINSFIATKMHKKLKNLKTNQSFVFLVPFRGQNKKSSLFQALLSSIPRSRSISPSFIR
jgi:hypothetical protein